MRSCACTENCALPHETLTDERFVNAPGSAPGGDARSGGADTRQTSRLAAGEANGAVKSTRKDNGKGQSAPRLDQSLPIYVDLRSAREQLEDVVVTLEEALEKASNVLTAPGVKQFLAGSGSLGPAATAPATAPQPMSREALVHRGRFEHRKGHLPNSLNHVLETLGDRSLGSGSLEESGPLALRIRVLGEGFTQSGWHRRWQRCASAGEGLANLIAQKCSPDLPLAREHREVEVVLEATGHDAESDDCFNLLCYGGFDCVCGQTWSWEVQNGGSSTTSGSPTMASP